MISAREHNRTGAAIPLLLLTLLLSGHLAMVGAEEALPIYAPGEVIVKLKPDLTLAPGTDKAGRIVTGLASLDRLNHGFGVVGMSKCLFPRVEAHGDPEIAWRADELSRIHLIRLPDDADVGKAVRAYQQDANVIYAQPNFLNRPCVVPDDSLYGEQWALSTMQMPAAWDIERGSQEVLVGIVDSGIDFDHRDLATNVWINPGEDVNGNGHIDEGDFNGVDDDDNGYVDDISGWDFTDAPQFAGLGDYTERDNLAEDDLGHGSHVSGIVAAVADNGVGVAGLCWYARLMPLRASFRLSVGAFLEDDDVSAGIVYAADNGANVINMSWGDPRISPMIRDVIAYADARGCVMAAAAGNVDQEGLFYPAGFDQTIAAGASTIYDQRSTISSFGKNLDVLAPGSNIMSTLPGDEYGSLGGTSMAAAHVSGLAALILSRNPDLSPQQVRGIINASAVDLEAAGWDPQTGNGRIDGLRALLMDQAAHVQIHQPATGTGVDAQVAILGTVLGLYVDCYELGYGLGLSPTSFQPILGPVCAQAVEETLAVWDGVAQLPDTACTIRLKVWQTDGQIMEDRVVVHIDHSPPVLEDIRAVRRLDEDQYAPFLEWSTDDETLAEIHFRRQGEEEFSTLKDVHIAQEHSLDLSTELDAGDYEYYLSSANASGLETVEDNAGQYYHLSHPFQMIDRGGFLLLDELPLGYHFDHPVDLDRDGRQELLYMAFSDTSTYGPAVAYEMDAGDTLREAFRSQAHYLVWDVGDSDGDGKMEILGGGYAVISLFESPDSNSFPDPLDPVWTREGVWGSQMADTDGDGRMEIISKVDVGSDVIVFENVADDSLERVAVLSNPTEGRNSVGTRFAIADFDGDGRVEILVGDSDGDLYIYESSGDNRFQNTWTGSTDLEDARYLAVGDSLPQGGRWFAVAANETDVYDPRSTFWRLSVYEPTGNDDFAVQWEQEVAGVGGQGSGLIAADFTGDGNREIALCALPDLYFFRRISQDDFQPIWYTSCGLMYRPFVGDLRGDGSPEIAFNGPDFMVVLERGDVEDKPPAPAGLVARPLDVDRVALEWMPVSQAASYRLYRGKVSDGLGLLKSGLVNTTYLDSGLTEGTTYYYAVTSVDSLAHESQFFSTVVSAMPNAPPQLVEVEVIAPVHLGVSFSEPMGSSAQVASHYQIDGGVGAPTSVVLDHNAQRAFLTLSEGLVPEHQYALRGENIYDATGVPLSAQAISFQTPADTAIQALFIRRVELSGATDLEVRFSEAVDRNTAEDTSHYVIEPSVVVRQARVDSAQSDLVRLSLNAIRARGILYTLYVSDIWNLKLDRSIISGRGDAASFYLPAVDLTEVTVAPNPFSPEEDDVLRFANLPPQTTANLFTLSGDLVWTGREGDTQGAIDWPGLNESGQPVASGVYLYLLESDGEIRRGKLVVIR